MKAARAIGKRIVAVEQSRVNTRRYDAEKGECTSEPRWTIDAIVLEDGTRLCFYVVETDAENYVGIRADRGALATKEG